MKEYKIRVYIERDGDDEFLNKGISLGLISVVNSFDGLCGCHKLYDVICGRDIIELLFLFNVRIFPLDHYEDFSITFNGSAIEDDMILTTYDERVLMGYNISTYNAIGKAKVRFL